MSRIDGYVVITQDGKLKRPRRSAPSIFTKLAVATRKANNPGDSVQPVFIDLDVQPVFIRERTL